MLLFLCAHSLVCSDFVILLYCDVFINLLTKLLSCVMCVCMCVMCEYDTDTHTRLRALFPELPGCAGTRKVKPIWILLKQETVSGSGISWPICKSASRSRQITMPVPHHWGFFYRPDALTAAQPTASKHWRSRECDTFDVFLLWFVILLYRTFLLIWYLNN